MSLETIPHQLYKGSQERKFKSAPDLSDKWPNWWFSQWQSFAHVTLILFLLKFERKMTEEVLFVPFTEDKLKV